MATRPVKTPGVKEEVKEQPQANVELVAENEELKKQLAEAQAKLNNKNSKPVESKTLETKVKRTRAVVGPNGWTTEEY